MKKTYFFVQISWLLERCLPDNPNASNKVGTLDAKAIINLNQICAVQSMEFFI